MRPLPGPAYLRSKLRWDYSNSGSTGTGWLLKPLFANPSRWIQPIRSHIAFWASSLARHEEASLAIRHARDAATTRTRTATYSWRCAAWRAWARFRVSIRLTLLIMHCQRRLRSRPATIPSAVQFAKQAITIDPEFWIGYLQLAQVYEQLGNTDLALTALNGGVVRAAYGQDSRAQPTGGAEDGSRESGCGHHRRAGRGQDDAGQLDSDDPPGQEREMHVVRADRTGGEAARRDHRLRMSPQVSPSPTLLTYSSVAALGVTISTTTATKSP
jgi:hypothetical protein